MPAKSHDPPRLETPAELSQDLRDRILAEETYRSEVRRQLEKQQAAEGSRGKAALTFLNSPVGIFLLSTVFVGLFTWTFDWVSADRAKFRRQQETIRKLRSEITNRIATVDQMRERFRAEDKKVVDGALNGFVIGAKELKSWHRIYSPVFLELRPRSLDSLLWELRDLVPEPEKGRVLELHRQTRDLRQVFGRVTCDEEAREDGAEYCEVTFSGDRGRLDGAFAVAQSWEASAGVE